MKWQRLAMMLSAVNFVLLVVLIAQFHPVAAAPDVAPVLRGRAFELVDDKGRVRAEMRVFPAQPNLKMPDGTVGFPEAVQLRLIDSTGGPRVKLVTTDDGSGLMLDGQSGYFLFNSRGSKNVIKLVTKDGREQTIATSEHARAK
jgi:hypothetical protein